MERINNLFPTVLLFFICGISCLFPKIGFGEGQPWYSMFVYHFFHANIFHLVANFVFLACFRPRWTTILESYLVATACAYGPLTGVSMPTCGISAMCFAMIARHDVAWRVLNWRLLLFNTALMVFPTFNWKIHLVSYIVSFAIWKIIYKYRN